MMFLIFADVPTTPWLVVALIGGGVLILLGGLFLAHRRRTRGAHVEG